MSIFARLDHEDRAGLRAYIVAEEGIPPVVKHFYIEKLVASKDGSGWVRSRKVRGELFEKMLRRLGFDVVEARFLLEEAMEENEDEESYL